MRIAATTHWIGAFISVLCGFYKPENRAELYRRIEVLDKHIGPDAK